jgi:hypothetical protein
MLFTAALLLTNFFALWEAALPETRSVGGALLLRTCCEETDFEGKYYFFSISLKIFLYIYFIKYHYILKSYFVRCSYLKMSLGKSAQTFCWIKSSTKRNSTL